MRLVHCAVDVTGHYSVEVHQHVLHGIATSYLMMVKDLRKKGDVIEQQLYHRDADAICDGWACVAALLAVDDSHLQGAYSIGVSEY